jgi:hypothetical protein
LLGCDPLNTKQDEKWKNKKKNEEEEENCERHIPLVILLWEVMGSGLLNCTAEERV